MTDCICSNIMQHETMNDAILQKMTFILCGEDLARINLKKNGDVPVLQIDVHGLSCKAAKRLISNVIAMYRKRFDLEVIHGYNHGTSIRDMIRNESLNPRICGMLFPHNQGVTILKVM